MGIFGSIMDKIFHHSSAAPAAPQAAPAGATASPAPAPAPAAAAAPAPQSVDVGAVLSEMASMKVAVATISRRS